MQYHTDQTKPSLCSRPTECRWTLFFLLLLLLTCECALALLHTKLMSLFTQLYAKCNIWLVARSFSASICSILKIQYRTDKRTAHTIHIALTKIQTLHLNTDDVTKRIRTVDTPWKIEFVIKSNVSHLKKKIHHLCDVVWLLRFRCSVFELLWW